MSLSVLNEALVLKQQKGIAVGETPNIIIVHSKCWNPMQCKNKNIDLCVTMQKNLQNLIAGKECKPQKGKMYSSKSKISLRQPFDNCTDTAKYILK